MPETPGELRFTEHIISLAILSTFEEIKTIFKYLSSISYALGKDIPMESKVELINEQRTELEKSLLGLSRTKMNFSTIDARILNPDRPFYEFFRDVFQIICCAHDYVTLILKGKPENLVPFEDPKTDLEVELTPSETIEEIRIHEIGMLEEQLVEAKHIYTKLKEQLNRVSEMTPKEKRECRFKFRMLGITVSGLIEIPITGYGERLVEWTNTLQELNRRICDIIAKLTPNEIVDENKNPLLYILSSLNKYEEELKRLQLVDTELLEDMNTLKFFLDSLFSLNNCVTKLRDPLSRVSIPEDDLNEFYRRTNALQDSLTTMATKTSTNFHNIILFSFHLI